jgi:hypothetical protein
MLSKQSLKAKMPYLCALMSCLSILNCPTTMVLSLPKVNSGYKNIQVILKPFWIFHRTPSFTN